MLGVTIRAVQDRMGHSTIEMTMRYAHCPEVQRDAVMQLEQLDTSPPEWATKRAAGE